MTTYRVEFQSAFLGETRYRVLGDTPWYELRARSSGKRAGEWTDGTWDDDILPSIGTIYYPRSGAPFPDMDIAAPFLARGFIRSRYVVTRTGAPATASLREQYRITWYYDGVRSCIVPGDPVPDYETTESVRAAARAEREVYARVSDALPDAPWARIQVEAECELRARGVRADDETWFRW